MITALRAVEALPCAASGALVVGDVEHPAGMIFVERNRVCWAVAGGMRRRLHDLLAGHREADEHQRAALKQHTVESLLQLEQLFGDEPWPLSWQARAAGLNPHFTFSAAELAVAAGVALVDETTAELVEDHLHGLIGTGCSLCSFLVEDDGHACFLAVGGSLPLPLDDLCDLADWAGAALEASPGFSSAMTHAAAASADGGTVAWIYEGQRCAAICPNGQALRRLVTTLDNGSLAMVLATRHSVLKRVRERTALAAG